MSTSKLRSRTVRASRIIFIAAHNEGETQVRTTSEMYRAIKYLVDVAITLAGSIMILPLSALVALSLWLTQERVLFPAASPRPAWKTIHPV